jgi:ATP-dependent helicase HrpB
MPRVFYDTTSKRVYAEEQLKFRELTIGTRRIDPPASAAAALLTEEVLAGRAVLTEWDHSIEQWILRLNLLAKWSPHLGLPTLTEADRRVLVEQLCFGSFSTKEIKDAPVKNVVKSWLSEPQKALLEKYTPERLQLANGRTPKITYEPAGLPHISLRIQELYGVQTTPRIAAGSVPVLLHILAPNMRPVQITQDLESFWHEHYPKVKQELRRKYPKHEWQ